VIRMLIASWNVNSIKVRLPHLLQFLQTHQPDTVVLQELKCETAAFPFMEIESAGYHALVKGQKAYNGVAIISKKKAELRTDILPGNDDDPQARYIEASIDDVIIASIYLPNGNPLGTEKFDYKLAWMQRLNDHAKTLFAMEKPVILAGDYNVIPTPLDARHPENWINDALYQPQSKSMLRALINQGYSDAFRTLHPHQAHAYTFYDYQQGAFERDDGIRIDHLLCSPEMTDHLQRCWIDKAMRGQERASDHVPILAEFK